MSYMLILQQRVFVVLSTMVLVVFSFFFHSLVYAETQAYIVLTITNSQGESGENVDIVMGETVTFSWFGEGVSGCVINPGDITAPDTDPRPEIYAGSTETVPDSADITYTISCDVAQDSVVITESIVVNLGVDPGEVVREADGSLSPRDPTITWSSEHAETCVLERQYPNSSYEFMASGLSGTVIDDTITESAQHRYRLTCSRSSDGESEQISVPLRVQSHDNDPQVILTAPDTVHASPDGRGTANVTLSTNDVQSCRSWNNYYSPTGIRYTGLNTNSETRDRSWNFSLNEAGTWRFEVRCYDFDGRAVDGIAETYLSYEYLLGTEPFLNLESDLLQVSIEDGSTGETTLRWESTLVSGCEFYMEIKSPSDTDFVLVNNPDPRRVWTMGVSNGSRIAYMLSEPGVYEYRINCYSLFDGSPISATTDVEVIGDPIEPRVDLWLDPTSMTPNPSTGNIVGASQVRVHYDVDFVYRCFLIRYRDPNGAVRTVGSVPFVTTRGSSVGSRLVDANANSFGPTTGMYEFELSCEHPFTREQIVATADLLIHEVDLLQSLVDLSVTSNNGQVTLSHTAENIGSCRLSRSEPNTESFTEMTGFSIEDSVTTDTMTRHGVYSYRLDCYRNFDQNAPYTSMVEIFNNVPMTVTGEASVQAGFCYNAEGNIIAIPEGYSRDADFNCIITGFEDFDITLDIQPEIVRAGSAIQLSWQIDGMYSEFADQCQIYGGGVIDPESGDVVNQLQIDPTTESGLIDTTPRYSAMQYRFVCTDTVSGNETSVERRLEVVPAPFEI